MREYLILTKDDNGKDINGTVIYPEEWCFAYNPNYIFINLNLTEDENRSIIVNIGKYDLTIALFKGSAKVYISKFLELLFDDFKIKRCINTNIILKTLGGKILLTSQIRVLWGTMEIGDQFCSFGDFKFNKEVPHFERNIVWFKNFPFTVSMFRTNTSETISAWEDNSSINSNLQIFRYKFDSISDNTVPTIDETNTYSGSNFSIIFFKKAKRFLLYDKSSKYYSHWDKNGIYGSDIDYNKNNTARNDTEWSYNGKIYIYDTKWERLEYYDLGCSDIVDLFEVNPALTFKNSIYKSHYEISWGSSLASVFDKTFDFTFMQDYKEGLKEIINLKIKDDKDGYYLRWIDRFGFIQYYLFSKGKVVIKNSNTGDTIDSGISYGDLYFNNTKRFISVSSNKTIKCCAVSLNKDEYEYVSSILTCPYVDFYLGKTKSGKDLWIPVNIDKNSFTSESKNVLKDLEISFTLPKLSTQLL